MIRATWWYDVENDRWNAEVDDRPDVNATGRSEQDMRQILVAGYSRVIGIPVTEADFEFAERE